MAATQLGLYNEALRTLGERRLASLTENREPRRVLDDIWDDGARDYCLEAGQWNFAMRAISIEASTDTIPNFGYENAFDKPSDFVRTCGVCEDEFFSRPLIDVVEETGFWFASIDPIYVRYISNSANYGYDLTRWPQSFSKYVAAYLAFEAAYTITQSDDKKRMAAAVMTERLKEAKSRDAMADATAFAPEGGWSGSRRGRSRFDRGKRNKLIG